MTNKGIVLTKLGDYTQAVQYFDKALKIEPDNVACLFYKGIALDKLGQHEQAKEYQYKAHQINPNYSGDFINKVSTTVSTEGIFSRAAI